MAISLKEFVEEHISEIAHRLGYTLCRLYSFAWFSNFEKFITKIFKDKDLVVILPAIREDREALVNIIRKLALQGNHSVTILYSERLSPDKCIICTKTSKK